MDHLIEKLGILTNLRAEGLRIGWRSDSDLRALTCLNAPLPEARRVAAVTSIVLPGRTGCGVEFTGEGPGIAEALEDLIEKLTAQLTRSREEIIGHLGHYTQKLEALKGA
jgi:hypothetical protein